MSFVQNGHKGFACMEVSTRNDIENLTIFSKENRVWNAQSNLNLEKEESILYKEFINVFQCTTKLKLEWYHLERELVCERG